jgi:hypothetical protein
MDEERFQRAIASIDERNRDDPHVIEVRGERRPKELAHSALAAEWVERLVDAPSEALRLAARAHHVRRWAITRASYPAGRAGYHRWRQALQQLHADEAANILATHGYDEATIERVQGLIKKRGLARKDDPEVQALEDALCLVFLETQLAATAEKLDDREKTIDVLRRTAVKMSPAALALAQDLPLSADERALLESALR